MFLHYLFILCKKKKKKNLGRLGEGRRGLPWEGRVTPLAHDYKYPKLVNK